MLEKLIPFCELERWRNHFLQGRLVVTNGCFDVLHAGHIDCLSKAAQMGTLLVGLNSDASVRKLKGPSRPVNSIFDRISVLCALECVSFVTVFEDERAEFFLHAVRPDIYVKGGDYTPERLDAGEREILTEHHSQILIIPALANRSTTDTVRKLNVGFS